MTYILILVGCVFVNNVVLSQFMGICAFLGVSKQIKSSVGMGGAVIFVMVCIGGTINSLIMAIFAGTSFTWHKILLIILAAILGLAVTFIVVSCMIYVGEIWQYHKKGTSDVFNMSNGKTRFVGDLLYYPVDSVFSGVKFVGHTVHSIYKKCCPLITWK